MQPIQIPLLGLDARLFFLVDAIDGDFGFLWRGSRRDHGLVNAIGSGIDPPGFRGMNAVGA